MRADVHVHHLAWGLKEHDGVGSSVAGSVHSVGSGTGPGHFLLLPFDQSTASCGCLRMHSILQLIENAQYPTVGQYSAIARKCTAFYS